MMKDNDIIQSPIGRRRRALTAWELAIVVAVVAVLVLLGGYYAGIWVVRKQIGQTRSDLWHWAVAAEAYAVDWSIHPLPVEYLFSTNAYTNLKPNERAFSRDDWVKRLKLGKPDSFGHYAYMAPGFWPQAVTTPIAYVSRSMLDPFSTKGDRTYGYMIYGHDYPRGYVLVGCGPDGDRDLPLYDMDNRTSVAANQARDFVLNGAFPKPLAAYMYDPTNGLRSDGDLIYIRQ